MNLITCPDCQRAVSPQAAACPGCGRPAHGNVWLPAPPDPLANEKQSVQLAYGLWAASFIIGPLLLASVVLAYVKRGDVRGTWLEAHYNWLIDTFWAWLAGGLLLGFVAIVFTLLFHLMGILMMFALVLGMIGWPIYRLVRGYTAYSAGREPTGLLSPPRW